MVTIRRESVFSATKDLEKDGVSGCYTYDDALELTGNGRYNYLLLAACSVINIAVALDIFGFALIVAAASCDLQMSMAQKGLLSSIPFAGLLFAFVWGYFADISGRRRALVWSSSIGFMFASLSSLASKWYIMLVLKFIGCSFSTSGLSITMTYLGECTSSKYRNQYLQVMNSVNLASEAYAFILALFILPLLFNIYVPILDITYTSWRLLSLLMSLPLGVGAVMMIWLKESPKFLANKGRESEALEVLHHIFKRNNLTDEEYPVKSLVLNSESSENKISFWKSICDQTVPIFKFPLLPKTLQLFYIVIVLLATNNVFAVWFPTIINSYFNSMNDETEVGEKSFCTRIYVNNTASAENDYNMELCSDVISLETIYSGHWRQVLE